MIYTISQKRQELLQTSIDSSIEWHNNRIDTSNRQSIAEMMSDFQKKSSIIRMKLQLIRNNNEEISRLTEIIQSAVSTQKEKESMKKVDQLQVQINKNTAEIKSYLMKQINQLKKMILINQKQKR
ncbi:unnamed protein product [Paramecium octaurelia]|uniref:Uncharacterized protein n=1 Tax=Paramecium octaurelia TaxID=43137 RepID=A0A8S1V1P2_PAROT|nr:unnamed protein product [Paramecium octaurelia]